MKYWFVNHPFALLLIPLIAFILCCTYAHWPMQLDKVAPLPSMPNDTARDFYPVVLLSSPQPRAKTYRYEARLLTQDHPQVLLYWQGDSTSTLPQRGDTVLVYTCLQQPDSLPGFDYPTYLHRQGISGTGYVPAWAWHLLGVNHTPWWRSGTGWQQRLQKRYYDLGIQGRELATLSALTLGYREDLHPNLKQQFSAAGAMHVLAVSGLHTGILMSVLLMLVTCFGRTKPLYEERVKRFVQGGIVILSLAAYAWLTGGSPSVVRSVVMASMFMLALMLYRQNQMLNALFASAFFILLFRPLDLFSVSFQLSYAAVFAIALFAPGWNRVMPHNYFLGLIGMTLAAMLGTMPVTLHYFGQISNYFLLTNLIVLPLAWGMMVGGLLTLTIGWITPIGRLLAWLLNGLTWLMNESVGWIESLPYSTTMVQLPLWGLWTLIAVNITILILWNKCTTPHLKWK